MEAAVAAIPTDKRIRWDTWATKLGLETSAGIRVSKSWTAGGWFAREWTGSWNAGARLTFLR
ncbi:MAG: hypothetical protein ABIG68_09160 [Acidobacteriota bacterium]